jgi:hypothetical protein
MWFLVTNKRYRNNIKNVKQQIPCTVEFKKKTGETTKKSFFLALLMSTIPDTESWPTFYRHF